MSDVMAAVMAVLVWIGAFVAFPFPRWLGAVGIVVALFLRRPLLLAVGAAVLASSLAAGAWAGLVPPRSADVDGWAVVARDPDRAFGAVRAELRLGGRRVDAWARGAAAARLQGRLAGEQVWVSGRMTPLSTRARGFLAPRHVAAHLDVQTVGAWRRGSLASRAANGVRRRLDQAAFGLDPDARSLLLGVVVGERRNRPPDLEEAFRAAGLSHLLAVSGQNVAFVLGLAAPGIRRLGLRGRWAVTLALLVWFTLLTRWEPSGLRAVAMAAIAATASLLGRPAAAVRLLSLAIAAAVLLDPLLVHALGFQLSVGATAGIALLAEPITRRLPGPLPIRSILAMTIAAQAGVLPVALPAFGGLPLAALPANLLAVPAAAPLTAWGFTGALLTPSVGPPAERWLQVPTVLLTRWLAGVARWAAQLPLGQVRTTHVAVLGVAGAFVVSARWSWRWVRAGSI